MVVSFSNSPIDRLYCWMCNKYEEFTRWYWRKSPHHVTCEICGNTMHSHIDKYSPEECGWRSIKGGSSWICHRCDAHRNFRPYIELADIDECIFCESHVATPDNKKIDKLRKQRLEILEGLK